jgi:hypothetical protein
VTINIKREALIDAIKSYQNAHPFIAQYTCKYGGSEEWAHLDVFDPVDKKPHIDPPDRGIIIDGENAWFPRIVLIAQYQEDGSIQVEETEDAKKYLHRAQTA